MTQTNIKLVFYRLGPLVFVFWSLYRSCFGFQVYPTPQSLLTVISVHDGDTVRLSDGRSVRLIGVDVPELRQPGGWGRAAQVWLERRVLGRSVQVEEEPGLRDFYGRMLGTIWLGTENVNIQLVSEGLAYAWTPEGHKSTKYWVILQRAQEMARQNKKGFWADPSPPEKPWEWRKKQRHNTQSSKPRDIPGFFFQRLPSVGVVRDVDQVTCLISSRGLLAMSDPTISGSLDVFNIGRGHLTFLFDTDNFVEVEKAKRAITDMLKRGYLIQLKVGKEYVKVVDFDPDQGVYYIIEPPPADTPMTEGVGATLAPKSRRGRRKGVPMTSARATAVGPTAGG